MTDKQKALEAFVVAMARRERHQNDGDSPYFAARDLLAAIEAEKQPEPDSIVSRLNNRTWDDMGAAIRDLERLAERMRNSGCPWGKMVGEWAHEIDGK